MKSVFIAIAVLMFVLISSCRENPPRPPATHQELQKVTDANTPEQIATFVFDNYGCKNCHTLGSVGKFGFTTEGEQLKSKSEGCIALLTAVHGIVAMPEVRRTAQDKEKLG